MLSQIVLPAVVMGGSVMIMPLFASLDSWEYLADKFVTAIIVVIPAIVVWLKADAAKKSAEAAKLQSEVNSSDIAVNTTITRKTSSEVGQAKEDIHRVEKATNSMQAALVEATAAASMAQGEAKGRADQKAESKLE